MRFEDRLARTARALMGMGIGVGAAGCDGGTDDPPTETGTAFAGVCEGDPLPVDHYLVLGWVTVPPGTACPDAADAQLQVFGCTFFEWQGITCGFERVDPNQVFVDDGYGGYFANATTAPTTTSYTDGVVVDVCYYEGVFYQDPSHPTCGRPLWADGAPVVAPVRTTGSRWRTGPAPAVDALTAAEREAIGHYWLEVATLEHASIASFSVFALDLMALGAPPELLRDAHAAARDEVDHAARAFALASAYLDRPLSPGRLAVPPRGPADGHTVAMALVREGCVAETLAAIDAAARLAGTTDPAVRETLAQIVADESAHAALAWRTLTWLLTDADADLRATLRAAFAAEAERWCGAGGDDTAAPTAAATAHGLVSARARSDALRRGWREVVQPAWDALAV